MNKKSIKLILYFSIILILFFVLALHVLKYYEKSIQEKENTKILNIEGKELKSMSLDDNNLLKEALNELNKSDKFAGRFIDSEGRMNINLVGDTSIWHKKYNSPFIVFHSVHYTYHELQNIVNKLTPRMVEFDITQVSIDEELNRVDVFMGSNNQEKVKNIIAFINSPALCIKDKTFKVQY